MARKKFNLEKLPELMKPVLITIGLVTISRLLVLIPWPFTDNIAIGYGDFHAHISIVALGLSPYFGAYLLVELLSYVIPYLKKLKTEGGTRGRQKLKSLAYEGTAILGIAFAYNYIRGLSQLSVASGSDFVIDNNFDYLVLIMTLVSGSFLLMFIAELISKYGIGHGISVLILVGPAIKMYHDLPKIIKESPLPMNIYQVKGTFLLQIAPFLLLIILGFLLMKAKRPVQMKHPSIPQPVDYFQLNLAPSGVAGLNPGFLVMPGYGVLLGFFYLEFSPGRLPYYAASFIILLIISSLATWIFLHPQQRMEALSKMGWTLVDITNSTLLKQALLYNLFWTVFVFYAQVLPDFMRYEFDLDLLSGGLSFIGGLTISLDIIDEASYYLKTGAKASVKAAEFHDVYEAQMVKTCLEANGIQCYLRGYNYRKMLYLFGPFIEMSLMVPSGAKDRAKELISEFYTLTGR